MVKTTLKDLSNRDLEITSLLTEHSIVVVTFKLVGAQTRSALFKLMSKTITKVKRRQKSQMIRRGVPVKSTFWIKITWKKARACSTWPFLISSTPEIISTCVTCVLLFTSHCVLHVFTVSVFLPFDELSGCSFLISVFIGWPDHPILPILL